MCRDPLGMFPCTTKLTSLFTIVLEGFWWSEFGPNWVFKDVIRSYWNQTRKQDLERSLCGPCAVPLALSTWSIWLTSPFGSEFANKDQHTMLVSFLRLQEFEHHVLGTVLWNLLKIKAVILIFQGGSHGDSLEAWGPNKCRNFEGVSICKKIPSLRRRVDRGYVNRWTGFIWTGWPSLGKQVERCSD